MIVTLLGIPFDANVSFVRGPAGGPGAIRAAYHSAHWHHTTELGVDLDAADWVDAGDLTLRDDAMGTIFGAARALAAAGDPLLALGGDHSVTAPLLRAAAEEHGPLTVFHIDAHTDLYHDLDGNPDSHGSPFARAMEAGAIGRLVQVGIRTIEAQQRSQIEKYGVEVITMADWPRAIPSDLREPLYVSLDVDGLDPAFAPGVCHPEPGGLSTRDVIGLLHALPVRPVAADLVEYSPVHDVAGQTAVVAAKLLKELLGRLVA